MPACRICGSESGHAEFRVHERMFGTGEPFNYFQCSQCGCLQIAAIPEDLSRHYPDGYYSFAGDPFKPSRSNRRGVRSWLRRVRIERSDRVLDVGCGQGRILNEFARAGFSSLRGIDPFVAEDRDYPNGVKIFKRDLSSSEGNFDLIMMHHSFEHMPDPVATLKEIHRLLVPGKFALIRIPLISSFAWKKYSTHWVSLDAPRHLYLHSLASMDRLARNSGFSIEEVLFDSTDFQFWGSEQYLHNIPLFAPDSYAVNRKASMFSWMQIKIFEAKALKLNWDRQGDQACFFLKKI